MIAQISFKTKHLARLTSAFLIALAAWACSPASASAQLKISKSQWNRLDAAMLEAQQTLNLPSLSVAVVHDGELVWSQSHGKLDANGTQDANPESLYAVASNTKAFTSAALAQLVDAGTAAYRNECRCWGFTEVLGPEQRQGAVDAFTGLAQQGLDRVARCKGGGERLSGVLQVMSRSNRGGAVLRDVITKTWQRNGGTGVQRCLRRGGLHPASG